MRENELSIATDFAGSKTSAKTKLEAISRAGFTHAMWCHDWNNNVTYDNQQINEFKSWFRANGLNLTDVHASVGTQKQIWSPSAETQDNGLKLLENRMRLAASMQSDVVVLHPPAEIGWDKWAGWEMTSMKFWQTLERAMEKLAPTAKSYGVKIAFENLEHKPNNFPTIEQIMRDYPADYVGLCYDSGHGNVRGDGLENLDVAKDRLISMHLHDNRGSKDEHRPIFAGSVDWLRLTKLIAKSPYRKPLSLEVSIRNYVNPTDEDGFLKTLHIQGQVLNQLVIDERSLAHRQ